MWLDWQQLQEAKYETLHSVLELNGGNNFIQIM